MLDSVTELTLLCPILLGSAAGPWCSALDPLQPGLQLAFFSQFLGWRWGLPCWAAWVEEVAGTAAGEGPLLGVPCLCDSRDGGVMNMRPGAPLATRHRLRELRAAGTGAHALHLSIVPQ